MFSPGLEIFVERKLQCYNLMQPAKEGVLNEVQTIGYYRKS